MSYLEENYLGDALVAPMQLPKELTDQLRNDTMSLADNAPVPPDYVRLPGGIVMKKSTALILGAVIVVAVVWYMTKKKKKK